MVRIQIGIDVASILKEFRSAKFDDPNEGNSLSARCIGNTVEEVNFPFERFCSYEEVMRLCQSEDAKKYRKMHKGTAFYFMSWLCFDMRSYEKALFYLDAAVSEDVRAWKESETTDKWKDAPAARLLMLDVKVAGGEQVGKRTIRDITALLTAQLDRFNRISGKPPMDLDRWRSFVTPLLEEPVGNERSKRTIVSALYVFMLEFQDRMEELEFRRGSLGGSNQPFTVHLFTGGLLFESLLKHFYPPRKMPDTRQIDDCFKHDRFRSDFTKEQIKISGVHSLAAILANAQHGSSFKTAFEVAGKLRNTTGHNLVWDDIFDDPASYRILYEQVINALLFVIEKNTAVETTNTSAVKVVTTTATDIGSVSTQTVIPAARDAFTSTVGVDDVTETISPALNLNMAAEQLYVECERCGNVTPNGIISAGIETIEDTSNTVRNNRTKCRVCGNSILWSKAELLPESVAFVQKEETVVLSDGEAHQRYIDNWAVDGWQHVDTFPHDNPGGPGEATMLFKRPRGWNRKHSG